MTVFSMHGGLSLQGQRTAGVSPRPWPVSRAWGTVTGGIADCRRQSPVHGGLSRQGQRTACVSLSCMGNCHWRASGLQASVSQAWGTVTGGPADCRRRFSALTRINATVAILGSGSGGHCPISWEHVTVAGNICRTLTYTV